MLGIVNHAVGKQRPNRDSATPSSFLRAIKLWYLIRALLHSQDGCIKSRQMVALVESRDIVLRVPWLIAFTKGGYSRQRDAAQEASEENSLSRAPSVCRHVGGVNVAARNRLAPHKGHAPSAEELSLPGSVDVSIAREGGMPAVGVPIGRQIRAGASNGGSEGWRRRQPCSLPGEHAGQSSCGPYHHRIPRAEDKLLRTCSGHGLSLEACRRAENGAQWAYETNLELTRAAEAQVIFPGEVPRELADFEPYQQA